MEALGYDRDFRELVAGGAELDVLAEPAPGWWQIELDTQGRMVRIPPDTHLDLGASAKAFVADRAARRIAHAVRGGVLVSIGGDVATAGRAPVGGWAVGIALDSSTSRRAVDEVVSIEAGGIASSSTSVRTWERGARRVHHIVDPSTGDCAAAYWRLVSASGDSCVDANAATTAAVVWGRGAVPKLVALGLPTRLVRHDGQVIVLNGWPSAADPRPVTGPPREMAS
jgi:thiamine biosynthesis lipoprotein